MISQQFRVDNVVTESTTMDNQVHSKENAKQFTKLFVENILYERNILNESHFVDYSFKGYPLKKIKDNSNNKFAKHFKIYFHGIEDALNKGYLRELILRICRKDNPNDLLEQYTMGYTYYPDENPKLYEESKTAFSLENIMNNMRYCIKKYFDPLPPVSDIDIYIYIKFFDDQTPADYIAPYFAESDNKITINENHEICQLGVFKTPFIKVKSRIESSITNQSDQESSPDCEGNGTPSIVDSQEETILIPDDDDTIMN